LQKKKKKCRKPPQNKEKPIIPPIFKRKNTHFQAKNRPKPHFRDEISAFWSNFRAKWADNATKTAKNAAKMAKKKAHAPPRDPQTAKFGHLRAQIGRRKRPNREIWARKGPNQWEHF
jgi:hypothetical protein